MSTLQPQSYKSPTKPIWCPGCGDYAVLNALMRTFADLELPPEEIVVASGIGCSSRFPAFLKTYGFHGVHGRPLPLATGIKLANPQRTVVAVGGDGDGFSIGGGHISHAARRNVDITYIVMDNNIYGMTKGQPSPTTPSGVQRKASPYGTQEDPLNPLMLLLACNASFVRAPSPARSSRWSRSSKRPSNTRAFLSYKCSHRVSRCITPTSTTKKSPGRCPRIMTQPT